MAKASKAAMKELSNAVSPGDGKKKKFRTVKKDVKTTDKGEKYGKKEVVRQGIHGKRKIEKVTDYKGDERTKTKRVTKKSGAQRLVTKKQKQVGSMKGGALTPYATTSRKVATKDAPNKKGRGLKRVKGKPATMIKQSVKGPSGKPSRVISKRLVEKKATPKVKSPKRATKTQPEPQAKAKSPKRTRRYVPRRR
jgi:hypothetical protein